MNYQRLLSVALLFCLFLACGGDEPEPILTATGISVSIDENPSLGQVLGTIQIETNQENLSFSLSNESAVGAMAIDASSGTVTVADASLFDFETSPQITARATVSAGGLAALADISITLNDVEESLIVSDLNLTMDENPEIGQVLGTIETNADELNVNEEDLTFTLSDESRVGAMAIDASTGTLTVADASLFDYEPSPGLAAKVTVTAGELWAVADIAIILNDVEETFIVFDFNLTIDENPSDGQELGTIERDSEQGNLQFQLVDESPEGALALDINTGLLTVANATFFDFENFSQITAKFEMNSGPLRTFGDIVISINNVSEEFTVSGFSTSIDENPSADLVLGTIQTDANSGDRNFSLSNESPMGTLAIDASSGTVTVADASLFDFETSPQITATVIVMSDGLSIPADITIDLNDVATVADFNISMNENPSADLVLGTIQTDALENPNFTLSNESPMGALAIDASNGTLSVADAALFDFETAPQITATVNVMANGVSASANININLNDVNENFTIWTGAKITFTKGFGADPTQEIYQDRITDNVWITRGLNGREIFNAATESSATKGMSPAGTEWAIGTTEDINDLTFSSFRGAVGSPREVVGKDLVLHLIEDDVYLDIKFLSWSEQRTGSFSYERSTQ